MNLQQKPHGLEVSLGYQILDLRDGKNKILEEKISKVGEIKAFLGIENLKSKQKITLPMRSFVNNFIYKLHGILTGDGGSDTKKSTVSVGASLTASMIDMMGILIGQGAGTVNIGDANLDNIIQDDPNILYKGTTFVPPSIVNSIGEGTPELGFTIKRLITNTNSIGYSISEIGIFARDVSASAASNAGVRMLARDVGEANFTYESNALFTYNFFINQAAAGNGGPVLNLMRLVYNLMFIGNQNNPNSKLIARNNSALSTIAYATLATAASNNPFIIDGKVSEGLIGIVIGRYSNDIIIPNSPLPPAGDPLNPDISGDETTFRVDHTDLTVSACSVSAITNPYTGTSEFSITRDFTLASDAATQIYNRIGLLTKGTANGVTIGTDQVFLCINRPTNDANNISLPGGLTLRTVYKFQIKV